MLGIQLTECSSDLGWLQAMMWVAQRTARCTPTGTSGSQSHAGSVCATMARSSVTRYSVKTWPLAATLWPRRESAAPFVIRHQPTMTTRTPLVREQILLILRWGKLPHFVIVGGSNSFDDQNFKRLKQRKSEEGIMFIFGTRSTYRDGWPSEKVQ